jgi:hypothetical protein
MGTRSYVLLFAGVLALSSCSSDAPVEPEPAFDQRGAFVAVDQGADGLMLFRTLSPWVTESGTFLFVTIYAVHPSSWDDAREISKNHDIPIDTVSGMFRRDDVAALPHRVVWFRTLTAEEEDRIP